MSKTVLIAIPVLLIGGTEVQTLNLVNVLVIAGYKVTVCCYYEYDQSMVNLFKEAGAEVHLMGYERKKGLRHLAKGLDQIIQNDEARYCSCAVYCSGISSCNCSKTGWD